MIKRGGSRISQRVAPTLYAEGGPQPIILLLLFPQKLHENENKIGQREGARPLRPWIRQ